LTKINLSYKLYKKWNKEMSMDVEEMKRIMTLLFEAVSEKDCSLIENYLANNIKWHDGCYGDNGTDVI
jgi:hypothetical protein